MSSSWTFIPGFSGAYDSFKAIMRKSFLLQAVLCLALMVAGCGDSLPSQSGPSPPANISAGSSSPTTLAPLIAPRGIDDRPLAPGSLGRPIGADGLPALQPVKGVNVSVETLFADDIKDPIERSRRLETAVVEMRRDLDASMPAIKRLVAIEKDIQLLSSQLGTLLNGEPSPPVDNAEIFSNAPVSLIPEDPADQIDAEMPAPMTEMPAIVAPPGPAPPPPLPPPVAEIPKAAPPPPATSATPEAPAAMPPGELAALGLRLGEHPGKTRLVFDMTGAAIFRTDLDNEEKILVVEIEKAGWSGPALEAITSPLIQSYATQPLEGGSGTRIILTLKKKADIASASLLTPEPPANTHRLVIDLTHE